MNSKTTSEKLIQFIENSPSAFHTVETIKFLLLKNNFSELCENKHWHITAGGNYFVTRNNSSLIAFSIPENPLAGMRSSLCQTKCRTLWRNDLRTLARSSAFYCRKSDY